MVIASQWQDKSRRNNQTRYGSREVSTAARPEGSGRMITLAFIYRSYRRKIRDLAWTTFADWDKRVCVHDGRHMGHTFHPVLLCTSPTIFRRLFVVEIGRAHV